MKRYFQSLAYWPLDVVLCVVISAAVTPADPFSMWIAFVPLFIVWMIIRFAIARRLSKPALDPSLKTDDDPRAR